MRVFFDGALVESYEDAAFNVASDIGVYFYFYSSTYPGSTAVQPLRAAAVCYTNKAIYTAPFTPKYLP